MLEVVRVGGTPALVSAMANDAIEIGNHSYSSLAIAIQNAGMDDLRVIADQFQDGVPGHSTTQFYVLKDSPVQKVSDLKGKVVASNAAGSAVDIAMRAMLRKNGLEDKRDYTHLEAPLPTMRAILLDKKADLVPSVVPFQYDPELQRIGRVLFTQRDAIGLSQMIVWTARKGFIDKNRAALVDFIEDAVRVQRWYLDPEEPRRGGEDRGQDHAPAARPLRRLVLTGKDYARSPRPAAEHSGAAIQHRRDPDARLLQVGDRRAEARRSRAWFARRRSG